MVLIFKFYRNRSRSALSLILMSNFKDRNRKWQISTNRSPPHRNYNSYHTAPRLMKTTGGKKRKHRFFLRYHASGVLDDADVLGNCNLLQETYDVYRMLSLVVLDCL